MGVYSHSVCRFDIIAWNPQVKYALIVITFETINDKTIGTHKPVGAEISFHGIDVWS